MGDSMRNVCVYLIVFLSCIIAFSCSPPKPAPLTSFADFCKVKKPKKERMMAREEDKWKAQYEKRVAFEGYIAIPRSVYMTDTMSIPLFENKSLKGEKISAIFKIGTSSNKIKKFSKSFKKQDLKVFDKNGKIAGYGAKVRLHGKRTVYWSVVDKKVSCHFWVDLVEKK